jgi:hypothetical protein
MPFDPLFLGTAKLPKNFYAQPRQVMPMEAADRARVVFWVSSLADSLGGWTLAADCTFGTGQWRGRRHGRRKDQRDALLVVRRLKRGFDQDDALDLCRRFMQRVAPSASWFAAVEPNPDYTRENPGFHLHMVIADRGQLWMDGFRRQWLKENGYCWISPIRSRVARENYCTKHLVGRGLIFGYEIRSGSLFSELESAL